MESEERERQIKLHLLGTIQRVVTNMDTDQDGLVNVEELEQHMQTKEMQNLLSKIELPKCITPTELLRMLDEDGDGCLGTEEFIRSLFRLIDNNVFQRSCMVQMQMNDLKYKVMEGKRDSHRNGVLLDALTADVRKIAESIASQASNAAPPEISEGTGSVPSAADAAAVHPSVVVLGDVEATAQPGAAKSARSTGSKIMQADLGLQLRGVLNAVTEVRDDLLKEVRDLANSVKSGVAPEPPSAKGQDVAPPRWPTFSGLPAQPEGSAAGVPAPQLGNLGSGDEGLKTAALHATSVSKDCPAPRDPRCGAAPPPTRLSTSPTPPRPPPGSSARVANGAASRRGYSGQTAAAAGGRGPSEEPPRAGPAPAGRAGFPPRGSREATARSAQWVQQAPPATEGHRLAWE